MPGYLKKCTHWTFTVRLINTHLVLINNYVHIRAEGAAKPDFKAIYHRRALGTRLCWFYTIRDFLCRIPHRQKTLWVAEHFPLKAFVDAGMKAWKQRADRKPSRQNFHRVKTSQRECGNQTEEKSGFFKIKKGRHQGEHRALLSYLQGKTGDLAAILSVNRICTPSCSQRCYHEFNNTLITLFVAFKPLFTWRSAQQRKNVCEVKCTYWAGLCQ